MTEVLNRTEKPILVYLDQCAVSELYKASAGETIPKVEQWIALDELLRAEIAKGSVGVPLTNVHAEECKAGGEFGEKIWAYAWGLSGGLMFLPKWEALWRESLPALIEYLRGKGHSIKGMAQRRPVLTMWPSHAPPLDFVPGRDRELDEKYERAYFGTADRWREKGKQPIGEVKEHEAADAEMLMLLFFQLYQRGVLSRFAGVEWMVRIWSVLQATSEGDEAKAWALLEGFLASKEYRSVPTVHLDANLWALHRQRIASGGGQPDRGDFNDADFLHRVVPHVDLVLTDIRFAEHFRNRAMELDKIAPNVRVFGMRDLVAFTDALRQLLRRASATA